MSHRSDERFQFLKNQIAKYDEKINHYKNLHTSERRYSNSPEKMYLYSRLF
jgi:hypothetical protein